MAAEENTNWSQSVTGIVIREGKVLLARHTYGPGKGKLIVPGGYVKLQESPQEALKREYLEETGVEVEPVDVIGIRFNQKDWYVAFRAEYKGGRAVSDGDENSEVLWVDVKELWYGKTFRILPKADPKCSFRKQMSHIDYKGTTRYGEYSFYGFV